MAFRTLEDFDFSGKRVLVRVGMDVPVDKEGNITNAKRIKEALPTLQYLLDHEAKQIVIINHMGRPKGRDDVHLNHDALAKSISEHLNIEVKKLDDCIDIDLPEDRVVLLENLRFHKEEAGNDEEFAEKLASYGDIFVNDAFSVSHRAQASVVGITKFIPSCAGLLLEREITVMGSALENPARPFIVILGGAKISDKLELIQNLLPRVDRLLLGGAMIFTFYKSLGIEVGKSLVEDNMVTQVMELLGNKKIVLPDDIVVGDKFEESAEAKVVDVRGIGDWIGMDIGPKTVENYQKILANAKTVVWNGPMGVFEFEKFSHGTVGLAKYLAGLHGAAVIVGGGDSASAIEKTGLQDKFTHISTGGGASLEFLEGKDLPGIKALEENSENFEIG